MTSSSFRGTAPELRRRLLLYLFISYIRQKYWGVSQLLWIIAGSVVTLAVAALWRLVIGG